MIRGGVVHARTPSRRGDGLPEFGALRDKADFGEAQKDKAEYGLGILCGGQAGVGAELIGSFPKAFFQRVVRGVFFLTELSTARVTSPN